MKRGRQRTRLGVPDIAPDNPDLLTPHDHNTRRRYENRSRSPRPNNDMYVQSTTLDMHNDDNHNIDIRSIDFMEDVTDTQMSPSPTITSSSNETLPIIQAVHNEDLDQITFLSTENQRIESEQEDNMVKKTDAGPQTQKATVQDAIDISIANEKKNKGTKKRKNKRSGTIPKQDKINGYIYKVVTSLLKDKGIQTTVSSGAITTFNNLNTSWSTKLSNVASDLVKERERKTLTVRDLQAALRMLIKSPRLREECNQYAMDAIARYAATKPKDKKAKKSKSTKKVKINTKTTSSK